jgi:hypothetical protein
MGLVKERGRGAALDGRRDAGATLLRRRYFSGFCYFSAFSYFSQDF